MNHEKSLQLLRRTGGQLTTVNRKFFDETFVWAPELRLVSHTAMMTFLELLTPALIARPPSDSLLSPTQHPPSR